jgi:hypothetical protein
MLANFTRIGKKKAAVHRADANLPLCDDPQVRDSINGFSVLRAYATYYEQHA